LTERVRAEKHQELMAARADLAAAYTECKAMGGLGRKGHRTPLRARPRTLVARDPDACSNCPSRSRSLDTRPAVTGSNALRASEWAEIERLIARTPNLSDVTASLILELLTINRRRLLHEH
jgi:hypothetical protein